MTYSKFLSTVLLLVCILGTAKAQELISCRIITELGTIHIALYPSKAPITVANFLNYVEDGAYENSSFFRTCTPENEADRTIKIEVIQGGNIAEEFARDEIPIETTAQTGLKHIDGTISMARGGPNTATSSFFICINDQPELDFQGKRNPDGMGFAAFGKVVKGMEVVKKIQALENKGQYLVEPVKILRIEKL
jgi:peptidyl-prolyl cis-trans isomerase A (cyclophilin A)